MNNWLIKLNNASVTLGGKNILRDISWQLNPSEHWAVFGSNGAGKSTFLRMLRGEVRPTQIPLAAPSAQSEQESLKEQNATTTERLQQLCLWAFDGVADASPLSIRPISSILSPEIQRHYVRQGWDMSGEEVILSGLADGWMLYTEPTEQELASVYDLAVSLGADYLLPVRMADMSQGQLRLVLLARALLKKPRLLLMDEACDGLDKNARSTMFSITEKIAAEGCSIIYVTHRATEMPACITNYMQIYEGHIIKTAPLPAAKYMDKILLSQQPEIAQERQPENVENCQGTASTAIFSMQNVDVYLKRKKILHGLNWQVEKGQHWLLSGANGSGKSTLLRLLMGEEHAALGGRLIWYDDCGQENKPTLEERHAFTSYVSDWLQNIFTYEMTGLELVISGLHGSIGLYREYTEQEKDLALNCLKNLNLSQHAETFNTKMSEGTVRRFLLARAIVSHPKLLLLDEPCSGLDIESRKDFMENLHSAAKSGVNLIFVSHSEEDMQALSDVLTHKIALKDGQIDKIMRLP